MLLPRPTAISPGSPSPKQLADPEGPIVINPSRAFYQRGAAFYLLANAPERVVERRRRPRDSPILSNSGVRATSRAAKQRSGLPAPEEQLASQRVSLQRRRGTSAPLWSDVTHLPAS